MLTKIRQNIQQLSQCLSEGNWVQALEYLAGCDVERMGEEEVVLFSQVISQFKQPQLEGSPMACLRLVQLYSRLGDQEHLQHWVDSLWELRDSRREGTRDRAEMTVYAACARLYHSAVDNAHLLLLLSIVSNECRTYHISFPVSLCVTGRRWSILRGSKDLSEWGRNYRAVSSILSPMLREFFPADWRGMISSTVGELLYEKNDLNASSVEIAGALSSGSPEIRLTGSATLLRITLADPNRGDRCEQLLAQMEREIEENGLDCLMPNFQALKAWTAIQLGNLAQVEEWVSQLSLNEFSPCTLDDYYQLMVLSQAYLAMGRFREAATLLERVILFVRQEQRPLDWAECLTHQAVACELAGSRDLALEKLAGALTIAADYGYIRVIADRGRMVYQLMGQLSSHMVPEVSKLFLSRVTEAAKNYAFSCPALYRSTASQEVQAPDLTPMEQQILMQLGEGMTNKEIGSALHIKAATVKFHMSNLFQKLGVTNRVSAVTAAQKLGLL